MNNHGVNDERAERCILALHGIQDDVLANVLLFSCEEERLAKLRDAINAELRHRWNRLGGFVTQ